MEAADLCVWSSIISASPAPDLRISWMHCIAVTGEPPRLSGDQHGC